MHLPSVKQLHYLIALAEHGHFGRAAEACFVSQSAFSVAIKELESTLGTRLVDRTNKSVTITRLGQDVVVQARLCLRDIEALVETAHGGRESLTGDLYLGVIPTIAPFLLPRVFPAIQHHYPKLKIFIREDITERIYAGLVRGELDALLIALPYELKNVRTEVLFRDHFMLAYRQGTTLIDPDSYRPNRLNDQSVLLLEDGHCLREQALEACKIRSMSKIHQFAATSLHTLVQMVDSDLGITYLPEMALASSLLAGTRIKTKPLRKPGYREIALAWRSGGGRDEEYTRLADLMREESKSVELISL